MIFPGNSYIALSGAKNALLTPFPRHIFIDFSLISKTWFGPTPQNHFPPSTKRTLLMLFEVGFQGHRDQS